MFSFECGHLAVHGCPTGTLNIKARHIDVWYTLINRNCPPHIKVNNYHMTKQILTYVYSINICYASTQALQLLAAPRGGEDRHMRRFVEAKQFCALKAMNWKNGIYYWWFQPNIWVFRPSIYGSWVITPKNEGFGFPWLVVSTHLKNIRQIGSWNPKLGKWTFLQYLSCHHPVDLYTSIFQRVLF